MLLQINDIRIEFEACGHCAAVPTEQDALVGIANHQKIMGLQPCAFCGKDVHPTAYELVHMESPEGGMGWYASPVRSGERHLWVMGPTGNPAPTAALHRECAAKALPYLSRECLEVQVSPWPEP